MSPDGSDAKSWDGYYSAGAGRPPRKLLRRVLSGFEAEGSRPPLHAIDLGCGSGAETRHLLENGWSVLAIDREDAAIARTRDGLDPGLAPRLETRCEEFGSLTLPAADLIFAGYSLPFCSPEVFSSLWEQIVSALSPGARFAGQFFGDQDSWAAQSDMTFHTRRDVERLLDRFDTVELNREVEFDGEAYSGPKHWHVFHVIARA